MGETPSDEERERADETAKLELPSLRLPRLGRRKDRARAEPQQSEQAEQPAQAEQRDRGESAAPPDRTAAAEPVEEASTPTARIEAVGPVQTGPVQTGPVQTAEATEDEVTEERVEPGEPADTGTRKRERTGPLLAGVPARLGALLTGVVVGLFGALLTYASLHGCDAVKGTESCGGSGLLLLVAILILMVVLGAVVLALFGISDARSTSFLGVGLLCVVVMVTLMEQLFSVWMFLVVPVLCGLSYLLAHWVTTAFVEPRPERGPEHDIR